MRPCRLAIRANARFVVSMLLMMLSWGAIQAKADQPPPTNPVRVVLPYAGGPLALSDDDRWVAAVHGDQLQLVDNNTRRIRWQLPIESRLLHAAFSPDSTWLAISDDNNIYRIDLDTGKQSVLLPNTTGRIVFHPDKPLLILLGHTTQPDIPRSEKLTLSSPHGVSAHDPANKPNELPAMLRWPPFKDGDCKIYRFYFEGRGLAIAAYNLEKNKWQYVLQTPIAALSSHAMRDEEGFNELPRGTDTFHIDGNRVYIYGVGGDLRSRVTNTFPADACLNVETGEAWINYGLHERPGRGFGVDHAQPEFAYNPPGYLSELAGVAEATAKRKRKMLDAMQSLTPRPLNMGRFYERDGSFIVHCPDRDTVQIASLVPTYSVDAEQKLRLNSHLRLIQLTCDGKLSAGPRIGFGTGQAYHFNGRLVTDQRSDWHGTLAYYYKLLDLESGEVLVARHHDIKDSRKKVQVSETWIAGNGLIGRNEANGLDFYHSPKDAGPAWTLDQPDETNIGLIGASNDGSRLVMLIDYRGRKDPELPYHFETLILESKSGDVLGRIQTQDHLNACGIAFDDAMQHITVAEHWGDKNPQINTYHIATGQLTESVTLPREKRKWCDLSRMDDPVEFLQNFNPDKAPDRYRLSFGSRIASVRKVLARGEPAWLIVGRETAHLFTVDDNEYLASYPYAEVKHSRRFSTRPRVTTIFKGNALLVGKGDTPGFDLIDLRTLETKLHVRLVPLTEGVGTILYTPDGTWDAAEKAKQYLSLYQGKTLLDAESAERYRSPEKITETIRALAR